MNFIPRLAVIYRFDKILADKDQLFFKGLFGRAIKQATAVDNAQDIMSTAYSTNLNGFFEIEIT